MSQNRAGKSHSWDRSQRNVDPCRAVASAEAGQLIAPNARPKPYVTAASITPTIVISNPDAHQERSVISDFTAPTAKCATMLIAKAQTTAPIPLMKKKGIIGMNAPIAVEIAAEAEDFHGDGKRCSESPSSLCAIACTS